MMTFHRSKHDRLRWTRWLDASHDKLIGMGIPHCLLEDFSNWAYFLDHCYYSSPGITEPLIDVDHMEPEMMMNLCLFLEDDDLYPDSSALNRLQFLLGRGLHG